MSTYGSLEQAIAYGNGCMHSEILSPIEVDARFALDFESAHILRFDSPTDFDCHFHKSLKSFHIGTSKPMAKERLEKEDMLKSS